MEYARAMALGGQKVYAHDCDFYSYDNLKLRCYVCGEPVYLKKGGIRKPHFAHIHATSSRQVEECNLRISTYGNSTETSSLIENRGQRLEIFQQHFINMISVGEEKIVNDINFNNWIDSIKENNNLVINKIIKDCIQYFLTHRQLMENKHILPSSKIQGKQIILQEQIALEAIDYLCVKSSRELLEYLICYSICKLYEHEQYKLLKREFTTKDRDNICHFAINVIMLNSWIQAFENIEMNNINIKNKSNIIRINKSGISNTLRQLPIPPIPYVVYGGKKYNKPITYTLEIINVRPLIIGCCVTQYKNVKDKNQLVKLTIITISPGVGNLQTKVEQISLQSKYIFCSVVENKNIQFSFHYDVISKMALPHWINNAETYVEHNDIAPGWLVVAQLWMLVQAKETEDLNQTHVANSFTAEDWYKALIKSHKLLPGNKQLQLAVASIPDEFKYLIESLSNKLIDLSDAEFDAATAIVKNNKRNVRKI